MSKEITDQEKKWEEEAKDWWFDKGMDVSSDPEYVKVVAAYLQACRKRQEEIERLKTNKTNLKCRGVAEIKKRWNNFDVTKIHWVDINDTIKDAVFHIKFLLSAFSEKDKELEQGDYWQKSAKDFLQSGGCPVCFSVDEEGHKQGCEWGEVEAALEQERGEKMSEINDAIKQYQEDNLDEKHCSCVPLLKAKIKCLESRLSNLKEEHEEWAKIMGYIFVMALQGNYEAVQFYAKNMKIGYKSGNPIVVSEVLKEAKEK